MTTPSKSQTDIPSVEGLNTVTPETINEAALQYVYALGDVDKADEAVAAEPETPVDPIMTIMPVGEAIIIEEPEAMAADNSFIEEAPADLIWIMPSEETYADGEVYEDVLVDELIDPIFTIMPVDEGIIIDEVILDETLDGEVIDTPPEDIMDLVLVDPNLTIMPVDDYIFIDDMETIPEDSGFYEEVIDLVADTDPLDPLVMEKPFILDWSRDRGDEGNGDISLDNLDIPAPEQTLVSTWIICTFTSEDIMFSTEEPVADKGFTDIDAGAATEITLLGLPETIEFIA